MCLVKHGVYNMLDKWYKDVKSNDFLFEIGAGNVPTHFGVFKFGENDAVPTSPGATMYDGLALGGTSLIPHLNDGVEQIFQIVGGTNDTALGTGARTIRIYGLKANKEWQVEDIVMNGTTNVPTVGKYWRIFRMRVLTSGTRSGASANITASYDGDVYAGMVAGNNTTMMAVFTIPAGYKGLLLDAHVHAGAKTIDFSLKTRAFGGPVIVKRRAKGVVLGDSHLDYKIPRSFAAGTDIEIEAVAASPPAGETSADFTLVLIKLNNDVKSLTDSPTI